MSEIEVEEKKSTHKTEVFQIQAIEKHPNADTLGIVHLYGYNIVCRLADWKVGDLAAYIVPDSLVSVTRPEFAFLKDPAKFDQTCTRIKVKRLRGIFSMGLMVPAPAGSQPGDDVSEILGVTRYEPPEPINLCSDSEAAPSGAPPVYDVESYHRYLDSFVEGETVWILEKIHGASSRFTWINDRLHCGSHRQWKKDVEGCVWWRVARQYPGIEAYLKANPGHTIYGEVYGQVQDLTYGTKKGEIRFIIFDILTPDGFMPWLEVMNISMEHSIPHAPVLYHGPLNKTNVLEFAEGESLLGPNIREGCCVRPEIERYDPRIGYGIRSRVHLKIVGNKYLEKA